MPWTPSDADRFKKGLTDAEKERWARIANSALASCVKKGGDELDCEVKAIKQANGSFSGVTPDFANFSNPLRSKNDEPIRLALADVGTGEGFQLVFPIGAFKTGKYGEVIVTKTFAQRMVDHFNAGVLGTRGVYLDTNHDFGEANGWAKEMRVTNAGLEVLWDFNARGRKLIADKRYRYYSAAIGVATDLDNGEEIFPVLHSTALTNDPVMNQMPEAHLSNAGDTRTHSDPATDITGGDDMEITLKEVLEYCKDAQDSERTVIMTELGFANASDLAGQVKTLSGEKETLEKTNADLTKRVNDLQTAQLAGRKTKAIETALSEGRVLPKDKEYWEKKFDENPDFTEGVLSNLPKVVDLKTAGHGGGGTESEPGKFSAEAKADLKKFGLTEEEIAAYEKDHPEEVL